MSKTTYDRLRTIAPSPTDVLNVSIIERSLYQLARFAFHTQSLLRNLPCHKSTHSEAREQQKGLRRQVWATMLSSQAVPKALLHARSDPSPLTWSSSHHLINFSSSYRPYLVDANLLSSWPHTTINTSLIISPCVTIISSIMLQPTGRSNGTRHI